MSGIPEWVEKARGARERAFRFLTGSIAGGVPADIRARPALSCRIEYATTVRSFPPVLGSGGARWVERLRSAWRAPQPIPRQPRGRPWRARDGRRATNKVPFSSTANSLVVAFGEPSSAFRRLPLVDGDRCLAPGCSFAATEDLIEEGIMVRRVRSVLGLTPGQFTSFPANDPSDVAVDAAGNAWFTEPGDVNAPGTSSIGLIDAVTGAVTRTPTTDGSTTVAPGPSQWPRMARSGSRLGSRHKRSAASTRPPDR